MGQGSIIGYEINEKTCQISFYNEKDLEPDTLEVDTDNYQIPLIIGKLRDTWAYGKEAKRLVTIKDGFTATRLLTKVLLGIRSSLEKKHTTQCGFYLNLFRCRFSHFRRSTVLFLQFRLFRKKWRRCSEESPYG